MSVFLCLAIVLRNVLDAVQPDNDDPTSKAVVRPAVKSKGGLDQGTHPGSAHRPGGPLDTPLCISPITANSWQPYARQVIWKQ